ncbi:MAG: elongation factor G [Clostridia bacterium]|nr:elongation factor G [Clostridia bacterium]MBR5942886.1 elongation factor G [Clostridia bacterium]
MKTYPAEKIRNVVFLGHGGKGKTSLIESMLYLAKVTERLGKVDDGNSNLDFDPEEARRKISISLSLASFDWKGTKINAIDTPGYFDFEGEAVSGAAAADAAVIVLTADNADTVGTYKAMKLCKKNGLARAFFINRVDDENASDHFYETLDKLHALYGSEVIPVILPAYKDRKVECFVNLLDNEAYTFENGAEKKVPVPDYMSDKIEHYKELINEGVAEVSEELMEKYFSGEPFTEAEIKDGIAKGIVNGSISPVYPGVALTLTGIVPLLDGIVHMLPSPVDAGKVESGAPVAQIFKTVADDFVGKVSYFRVYSGEIKPDMTVYNPRANTTEKIAHVYNIVGKKQIEVDTIPAGDIGAVTKMASASTCDTLCTQSNEVTKPAFDFPKPCLTKAIAPKAKGDEEKIASGLRKLMEEDPTISFENNAETKQQVISGMGETQLDVIVSKLKNSKSSVAVDLTDAKVPYREKIRKKVEVQGRHKKQSGGHGQFGDVWIRFEPCEGDDMIFEEEVFGGSVPKNFFPAVEKGLRDSVTKGVLAGYPVVGLKATLYDGSYHPVDSSEMAFKIAANLAYKEGMAKASPVLLEPIANLKVIVPNDMMGDVMGDVSKRRGRILGMNPAEENGMQIVEAEVPMAEMSDYAIFLRSLTQGKGWFEQKFERYDEAPANEAQKVIDAAAKENEE